MPTFATDKQGEKKLKVFVRESLDSYADNRIALARRQARDILFYHAIQWIMHTFDADKPSYGEFRRLFDQWDPNKAMRVTVDRTAYLMQKMAAGSHPSQMSVEGLAPEADRSVPAQFAAQVLETTANTLMDATGYRESRKIANLRRVIAGDWCVGMSIAMDEDGAAADVMRFFDFDPTHLTFDPHNESRTLIDHEHYGFTDVWTYDRAVRTWPQLKKINKDELKTVGDLAPMHLELDSISLGTFFGRYKANSKSKGVLVHQWHLKGDRNGDRFEQMPVLVEAQKRDGSRDEEDSGLLWVNRNNPESPIGGDGAGCMMLHGHGAGMGMWSMSDVHMVRGDQNRINSMNTLFFRVLADYAHSKKLVDIRSIPNKVQVEDYRRKFNNRIGGIIEYDSGVDKSRPANPPQYLTSPAPPTWIIEATRSYEEAMKQQAHRSDLNFGVGKTHVPDATSQRLFEESDEVLGIRVREDAAADARFLVNLLGTGIDMAKRGSRQVLARLKVAGFGPEEFTAVAAADPLRPAVTLRVRSIRHISDNTRRQQLDNLLVNKGVSPMSYRREMAGTLDSPVFDDDRHMLQKARKAAMRVAAGEEWSPLLLGEHAETFLAEFRRIQLDDRVRRDPEAMARVQRAIVSQLQAAMAEQGQPATAEDGNGTTDGTDGTQTFDLSAALDQIESGGAQVTPA